MKSYNRKSKFSCLIIGRCSIFFSICRFAHLLSTRYRCGRCGVRIQRLANHCDVSSELCSAVIGKTHYLQNFENSFFCILSIVTLMSLCANIEFVLQTDFELFVVAKPILVCKYRVCTPNRFGVIYGGKTH